MVRIDGWRGRFHYQRHANPSTHVFLSICSEFTDDDALIISDRKNIRLSPQGGLQEGTLNLSDNSATTGYISESGKYGRGRHFMVLGRDSQQFLNDYPGSYPERVHHYLIAAVVS